MAKARRTMLALFAIALLGCAGGGEPADRTEATNASPGQHGLIIIGVAETENATESTYSLVWRRVDPETNQFLPYSDETALEIETDSDETTRIARAPGEFAVLRASPGLYALDSVYAVLNERNLRYYANGVVAGPQRPSFVVGAGQAVYLGIWRLDMVQGKAVAELFRLEGADLNGLRRVHVEGAGRARPLPTNVIEVPCEPHRINASRGREIC